MKREFYDKKTMFSKQKLLAIHSMLGIVKKINSVIISNNSCIITLTSSAVISSVTWGGCYVLKTVTPTETRSAATEVSLPSVLRGARVPVINACPEPSADHVCCAVN